MTMGAVKLELRCPQNVDGIAADPDPDWNFDALLSELNTLETKLNVSYKAQEPFIKSESRYLSDGKSSEKHSRPFVMRVFEDEVDGIDIDGEEFDDKQYIAAKRFNYDELYLSNGDQSCDEAALEVQPYLMEEVGLVEGALFELTLEHQLGVKEEIRNRISALETDLMTENEKCNSALLRIGKYGEARRETERKFDFHYQRKIAEALDNHLIAVQRDHEHRSQIEERKIRDDAAYEEVKRKEKSLREEKLRQEKAKAETEMQAKRRVEEAERALLESQRRAAKDAADGVATETSNRVAARVLSEEGPRTLSNASLGTPSANTEVSGSDNRKKSPSIGHVLKAAGSALKLEQERFNKLKELYESNHALRLNLNKDLTRYERSISKLFRQISGTTDIVREKAQELVKILKDPNFPRSLSIEVFAERVVSYSLTPSCAAFACGYVIVFVTSQVPDAMDVLLAEFHKACIFTVPKHITYSESSFESKEAYYKTIGFQEDGGKIESEADYVKRIKSYMTLYGALVQTEVPGFQNIHGLKEAWAWLARFLNGLPANKYTATALSAFLSMAGFALFKKYRSQFRKMLNIISDNYLNALKARKDATLNPVISEIQSYIEDARFLQEPEGRTLETTLQSNILLPESDEVSYNQQPYGRYNQQPYGRYY